jgi:hypothetical protein
MDDVDLVDGDPAQQHAEVPPEDAATADTGEEPKQLWPEATS